MELQQTITELENYEFNNSQNALFQELSNKMRFVSIVMIALQVPVTLLVALGLLWVAFDESSLAEWFNIAVAFTQVVVFFFVSRWTAKTASSFKLIVTTEGNDLENLMLALGEMRKLYKLQRRIIEITLVLFLIRPAIDFLLVELTSGQ